jgi:hypothetical protein
MHGTTQKNSVLLSLSQTSKNTVLPFFSFMFCSSSNSENRRAEKVLLEVWGWVFGTGGMREVVGKGVEKDE